MVLGAKPVEGWMLVLDGVVYAVKGCEHPLPCLHVAPKRRGRVRLDPFEPIHPRRWSRCLLRTSTIVCPWDDPRLLNPVEELERMMDSGWQDPVVGVLYSVVGGSLGVTGSNLYGTLVGVEPRDVDLVVYGEDAARRALEVILELWTKGVARPPGGDEYGVVRREVGLDDWALIATRNPLIFQAYGRRYSVRLVSCKEPLSCTQPLSRQPVYTRVVLEDNMQPCMTPAVYRGRLGEGGRVWVYSLRSSLACLPRGTLLEGVFNLEVYAGYTRLVPDGGFVRIQVLQE